MKVTEVKNQIDRNKFIHFPWEIYKGNKNWCPPLLRDQRKLIDLRHPFHKHGESACFIASDESGKMHGRLMVSVDKNSNSTNHEKVACAGLFESFDNIGVAQILFEKAETWAREKGLDTLRGPITYSTNYPVGLLINAFDEPQRILMNYNPPYYERLFENYGFKKAKDLWSWWDYSLGDQTSKIDTWGRRVDRVRKKSFVTIRSFDRKHFQRDILLMKGFCLEMLSDNWGYVKPSDAEFEAFVKDLKISPPDLTLIAEHEGKVVGLSLTLPDYNEALRPINGRLFSYGLPIGLIKFLRNIKKIKTGRVTLLGVAPGYRTQAIAEKMIIQTLQVGRDKYKISGAEMGWTVEDNVAMARTIESLCSGDKKIYRVYQKSISL